MNQLSSEQQLFVRLREAACDCGMPKARFNRILTEAGQSEGLSGKHPRFLAIAKSVAFGTLSNKLNLRELDSETMAHKWVFEGRPDLVDLFVELLTEQPVKIKHQNRIDIERRSVALIVFESSYK